MNVTSADLGSQENIISAVILLLIAVPLIIIIVFGNSLVILSWIVDKRVRLSPQNAYYVSLAFTDLLIGVFVLPILVASLCNLNQGWIFGLPLCKTFLIFEYTLASISVYHLVIIAADRCQTITEGITYLQRTTLSGVYERCAFIWVLGLTISMPLIFDFDHIAFDPKGRTACTTKKSTFWGTHVMVYCYIVPLYLILRIYANFYSEIKKRTAVKSLLANSQPDQIPSTFDNDDDNSTGTEKPCVKATTENIKSSISIKREQRAIKTVAIIISAYVMCWTPWFLLTFYSYVVPKGKNPSLSLVVAVVILGLINSAINPIIYAFRHPEFRNAFQKILKLKYDRKSLICLS